MDKININGYDWVRLNDVCDILRFIKENPLIVEAEAKIEADTLRRIAMLMFYDERKAAQTDEEKEAALELPGDFIVCKRDEEKKMHYFSEWKDGEAVISDFAKDVMYFDFESTAGQVANKLGEGWRPLCMGFEYGRISRRLLDTLFEEDEEEEEENEEADTHD